MSRESRRDVEVHVWTSRIVSTYGMGSGQAAQEPYLPRTAATCACMCALLSVGLMCSACADPSHSVSVCQPGETECEDLCVRLDEDVANCGACGIVCTVDHGFPACMDGACTVAGCEESYVDCDGRYGNGCETDTSGDPANCGGCDAACTAPHGEALCVEGSCTVASCDPPFADCNGEAADGCETDVSTDMAHCGGCGEACTIANGTGTCQAGTCVIETCDYSSGSLDCWPDNMQGCPHEYADCNGDVSDGCEVDLLWDADHCWECGNVCDWTDDPVRSCDSGVCNTCLGIGGPCQANCNNMCADGAETVVCNNPLACGWCNVVCEAAHGSADCVGIYCDIESCDPGYDDCDEAYSTGCETDLMNDPSNCGTCGHICPSGSGCALGNCT